MDWSKAVALLLWIGLRRWFFCCGLIVYCCPQCLLGFGVWPLFCYAVLSVISSFAIISLRKRELVAAL